MIIAIDGPAASGKSSISSRLAAHYGIPHLNTGLLYRGVAQVLLRNGDTLTDIDAAQSAARALDTESLHDPALKDGALGEAASVVAAIPEVRTALLGLQRSYIARARASRGAVIEGRDIGSVICPDAERKIFVTASIEERARRRHLELTRKGEVVDFESTIEDLRKRDKRDASRETAPLVQTPDAYLLDTTKLDIEAALRAAVAFIGAAHEQ